MQPSHGVQSVTVATTSQEVSTGEQYNGYTLMVYAYAALWLVLLAWLGLLWQRQRSLASRMNGLEAALGRAQARVSPREQG